MSDSKAFLYPAYVWDCDECGRENFERAMVPELSTDEKAELCDEHGVDPDEDGAFMCMPEDVKCRHCGTEFESVHGFAGEA